MKQFWLTIFFLGLLPYLAAAQYKLSGTIQDQGGSSMPYASLYLKKAGIGTVSKSDGRFELQVKQVKSSAKLDTLVVSYVGYTTAYVPVYFNQQASIDLQVVLSLKSTSLQEVVIAAERNYTPEQIVRKAIKKVRKNYSQDAVSMNGFYRELIKENDQAIELNEASIQLNYSSYPQKRFTKSAFRKYWTRDRYTMRYGMSLSRVFRHSVYFPYYVSPKDEASILASRTTNNNSRYGHKASPVGGPLDLVALDRIKYNYDFLDRKLIKDYDYQLAGKDYVADELCYVIDYKPTSSYDKVVFQAFNQRMRFAIYVGQIFISMKDFSVLKITTQLALDSDFSVYNGNWFIPEFMQSEVSYKRYKGKVLLHEVVLEQRNRIEDGATNIVYTCQRKLTLFDPVKQTPIANPESTIPITHFASLKERSVKYDPSFWEKYEQGKQFIPLESKERAGLEKFGALEVQFQFVNYPIDSIPLPVPLTQPVVKHYPTDVEEDHFAWLEDKNSTATLDYLESENNYYEGVMRKLHRHRQRYYYQYLNLFAKDTNTVMTRKPGELYFEQDSIGTIGIYRKMEQGKELVLDHSFAAQGKGNFFIESLQFNRKNKLAYTYSQQGDISFTLLVKTEGKQTAHDSLRFVQDFLWLNDSILLYTQDDSITFRTHQLRVHRLSHPQHQDALIYQENRSGFDLRVDTSQSGEFLFLFCESLDESACFSVARETDSIQLTLLASNQPGEQLELRHFSGSQMYKLSNSPSGSGLWVSSSETAHSNWQNLYTTPHPLEEIFETKHYIAIQEYINNKLTLKCLNKQTASIREIELPETIGAFDFISDSTASNQDQLKINFESPTTPYQVLSIDLNTAATTVLRKEEMNAHVFGKSYFNDLLWTSSSDGTKLPITVFYDKKRIKNAPKGLIVKAYSAYGAKQYPYFDAEDVVYANDSFVVAYVHARGGGELGGNWYLGGKLFNKKNTFVDYVSATEFLQQKFKVTPQQTIGTGSSAGGLIMGYVANNHSELFGALIFDKPYLDVISTMMDSTLPLTAMEVAEWGDPQDSATYAYIKTYSPYQNIAPKSYPNMLFLGKYNDLQAPYWQIAKCVASYRKNNQSDKLILMNTSFTGGHRGSTSFEEGIDESANQYAFISYLLSQNKAQTNKEQPK